MFIFFFIVKFFVLIIIYDIPKFINIKADAHRETLEGVAGALSSASAINYGARAVDGTKGDPIANCIDVALALQSGLPNGYTITSAGIGPGDTVSCIVSDDTSGDTTTFTGLGVR